MSAIQLPVFFQDHMMIQREKPLKFHGSVTSPALSGKIVTDLTVSLRPSGASQNPNAPAVQSQVPVQEQIFICTLPALSAATGYELAFYLNDDTAPVLKLTDISIGDIWMACGQSNMEYFLRYDADWNHTKNLPFNPDIHMFNMPRIAWEGQKRNFADSGIWFHEQEPAWPSFSAPGYSFARNLQSDLKIPIGIIGCNWGGTPACAWMDEAWLKTPPLNRFLEEYREQICDADMDRLEAESKACWEFEDSYRHQLEWMAMMYGLSREEQLVWMREHTDDPVLPMGPWHHYRPGGLFQTMLRTASSFPICGVLWYQGESDSHPDHAFIYDQTMRTLINGWRTLWKDPAMPFLFVQLAPFHKWLECTGDYYAVLRSRQELLLHTVSGTGMASIMDLGEDFDIHPKFKMEVGRRLALLAKDLVYHCGGLSQPPTGVNASLSENRITVYFEHAGEALHGDGNPCQSFRIYQSDHRPEDHLPVNYLPISAASSEYKPSALNAPADLEPLEIVSGHIEGTALLLEVAPCPHSGYLILSYAEEDNSTVHLWNSAGLAAKPFHLTIPVSFRPE